MQKAGQLSSHADCRNKYHPGMIGVRMKPADQQNEADHQRSTDQFRHWQGMAMRALIQLQTEQSSIFHPLLQGRRLARLISGCRMILNSDKAGAWYIQ